MNRPAPLHQLTRRGMIASVAALASLPVVARATPMIIQRPSINAGLMARAAAALDQHAGRLAHRDRIAIVDFARPSRDQRFTLVDMASGQGVSLLVAHGRGSDPLHSGWVEQFSNEPGSLASSKGAYVTAARYTGTHGDSQRLIGLDDDNSNAEARAIVIHPADYVSDALIATQGKLGRSEGCFALRQEDIGLALGLLGEGTLVFADRV